MFTRLLLSLPLLLVSCTGSSNNDLPDSDSERDVMARKLLTLQQAYDRLDDNGDGSLSRSEVAAGIVNEKYEGTTKDTVPLVFEFYDTNKNDLISLDEINAGIETGPDAALRLKKARAAQ